MNIQVDKIGVAIGGREVFNNISFVIEGKEMVAITGPSGCGKTTLLNCLGAIQSINQGEISINGSNAAIWKDKDKTEFWRAHAAFIYQDYGIIEDESVGYNVTLNKKEAKDNNVKEILRNVGLGNRGEELASVLSGGEKQRLGVARAIYKRANVIYADEPTASLDEVNRQLVIDLLQQCVANGAMAILATHDERLVAECDQVIRLVSEI